MSGYSQRGGFSLTWNVDNFTYSGMKKGERLKTPFFDAYSRSWCLMLYPRGKDDSNYIALEYGNGISSDFAKGFDYLFSILDSEGTPLTWIETDLGKIHVNIIRRDEVFGPRKNTFLPNNTLIIQSQIFRKGEAFSTPLLRSARTCIRDNRTFGELDIPQFPAFAPGSQLIKKFPAMTEYGSYLNITVSLDAEGRCKFKILQYTNGTSLGWGFSTCKVEALDAKGRKIMFAESEYFFEGSNQVWQFTSYITKRMLMCDQSLFLPNGTLSLKFECTLSSGVDCSYMEDLPTTSTSQGTDSAAQSAAFSFI